MKEYPYLMECRACGKTPAEADDNCSECQDRKKYMDNFRREVTARGSAKMGININDYSEKWTEMILDGTKTVETRGTNSLKPYIGKRVGIVQTGVLPGMAWLVGYMDIGEPVFYENEEQFRKDEHRHKVAKGSRFDILNGNGTKYGYPLTNVERCEPRRIFSRGIISRKI